MTEILNADETAKFLRLPKSTVYTYAKTGKMPACKLGKSWRFEKTALEEWLKKKMEVKGQNNE